MYMNPKELGIFGEKIAGEFLKTKGHKILDKNYYSKFVSGPQRGEIDIISKKQNIIHFIEVKTLAYENLEHNKFLPEDKVNFQKQRKIIKTAREWLSREKVSLSSKWQIDIISIKIDLNLKKAKIRHFKNITSL